MNKVLIQQSLLINKVLTENRGYTQIRKNLGNFIYKIESQWYGQNMGDYKRTMQEPGTLREDLLPPLCPKQQGKGEVTRTWKERDSEIEEVNL